jgi:hypothetical protein
MSNKHWRDVRSRRGNKLLFRYCPETDEIEIGSRGDCEVVRLDDHRPAHQRKISLSVDGTKHLCYSNVQYTVEASA